MDTVNNLYAAMGRSLTDDARTNMELRLDKQQDARKKEARHDFNLEEWGLTNDQVLTAFKPYLDFVKSRNIRIGGEKRLV